MSFASAFYHIIIFFLIKCFLPRNSFHTFLLCGVFNFVILFCAFQTMQLPTLKAELFTVLWDYITRDQHTRYFSPRDQFRYIKIQPKTIDPSTRLYRVCAVYSPEPRAEVYCLRLTLVYRNWCINASFLLCYLVSCNIVGVVIATVFFFVLFSVDVTDYQFNFLFVYFFFLLQWKSDGYSG